MPLTYNTIPNIATQVTIVDKEICPKCEAERTPGSIECRKCGVIFAKAEKAAALQLERDSKNTARPKPQKVQNDAADNPTDKKILQACPACNQNISPKAIACPHCGEPLRDIAKEDKDTQTEQSRKGCVGCMWLIGAVMFLGWFSSFFPSCDTQPGYNSTTPINNTHTWSNTREAAISESDYGAAWPLTVSGGTVSCQEGINIIFTTYDGVIYGLNGPAINKYQPIDPIWRTDERMKAELIEAGVSPNTFFPKIPITPISKKGQALCN